MGYRSFFRNGNSNAVSDISKSVYLTIFNHQILRTRSVIMCDEHTAKNLPVIRPKRLPYLSLPIMCNYQELADFLNQKGYSVGFNGSIEDSKPILFYNPNGESDFVISTRLSLDFDILLNLYPEHTIYYPEQLILD